MEQLADASVHCFLIDYYLTFVIPVQLYPLPVNPTEQEQLNEPSVLLQNPFVLQL